jgi:O-antigen biosynthesis protein
MSSKFPILENWEIDFPPISNNYDVSIVVCAFNKWEYTLNCLGAICKSLMQNTATVEVILVDDASNDNTQEVLSEIRGLRYVRNEINLGFLKSANIGANLANGRNIIFLNNDTVPIGNWIDPLLKRMNSNARIGAVGSKLVYQDGTLQEAGGIIFSDASGWNYGRGTTQELAEHNYPRKVDYCSGAALMIRSDLWLQIGGFDEQFAPAYYEDTDACFTLHSIGYEVWYEPASLVVHFEGISHGKELTSGLKAHQVANKEKFYNKWEKVLSEHFSANSSIVEKAARSKYKKRILIIDHQVPTPDQDSGSLRLFEIIQALIGMNFHVTFFPENGLRRIGYSQRLVSLGVELVTEFKRFEELISKRANFYEYAWVSRPGPAKFFYEEVSPKLGYLPLVYDSVDLHFQRIRRQASSGDEMVTYQDSLITELDELNLISKSDLALVVSQTEKEILSERTKTPIKVVSNVHKLHERTTSILNRSDLIFIGGFSHKPNEDGISWFIQEIFPKVLEKLPKARLKIIGSNVPNWLNNLSHPNISVIGWVEKVEPHYSSARVSIAPLRYGAGVKGKVGESLSLATPMVLTNVAAEGMSLTNRQNALIEDDPDRFAAAIIEAMESDDLWQKLSINGKEHIEETMGVKQLQQSLEEVFFTLDRKSK